MRYIVCASVRNMYDSMQRLLPMAKSALSDCESEIAYSPLTRIDEYVW